MKNKIKTCLFVLIIMGVIMLRLTYKSKNVVTKTKKQKQNNIAIMIKDGDDSDYTKSGSNDIPKGNYTLNRDKSYCKNNGIIGDYDNTTGKIGFSFVGTDSCYLYFDYASPPVIENVKMNKITNTSDFSVLVVASSQNASIVSYYYSIDGSDFIESSESSYTFTYTGSSVVTIKVKDSNGLFSEAKEYLTEDYFFLEVIPVSGTVSTYDGEIINIDSTDTFLKYIKVGVGNVKAETISGYSLINKFNVIFNGIISTNFIFYVPGIRVNDTIIVKQYINNGWTNTDASVYGDDKVQINLENEGTIAIYKKTS